MDGIAEFLCDALRPLGPVVSKRMFSGAGLFCDGLMFGLIFGDALYLKTDANSQAAFAAEGMTPFVYEAKGRKVALGYWRAPERLLDEPDDLVAWSRLALAVARSKAQAKAKAKGGHAVKRPRKSAPKAASGPQARKPNRRPLKPRRA